MWGEFALENILKENKLHSPHGLVQLCRHLKKIIRTFVL